MRVWCGAGSFAAIRRAATTLPAGAAALTLLLAGCDDNVPAPPDAGTVAPAAPVAAAQPSPPPPAPDQGGSQNADAAAASGTALANDPSAPANTPLCGVAAQESNALSRALLPRQYAEAGQCSAFACYDAATATFIGADGYRHVCR